MRERGKEGGCVGAFLGVYTPYYCVKSDMVGLLMLAQL